jgi:methionyl aminopeptidase
MNKIIIKTADHIRGIRKSCQLAAQTLKYIEEFVKEGVTTAWLDDLIAAFIRDHGGIPAPLNYNGFPKSSCISLNEVVCHGIPSKNTVLKEGDILNIDVTSILDGFYGDTSKMFSVGEIAPHAAKLISVTKICLDKGIEQCYPGNRFGNIGFAIAEIAHKESYSVVYEYCGHGVGLKFHEAPEIQHIAEKDSGEIMKAGMIFTIEPMINEGKARTILSKEDGWTARTIDNKLSAQYEHTILITDEGHEVLSSIDE